ncbi:MAG: hypothetical protein NUV63_12130 [Gallionella sp.]|nr:hypothetical protein [Gallionella sp.]
MKKRTGKGKGISINSQFTSTLNNFKQGLANVSEGVQVREWKDYKPSREMEAASARAAEIHKIPSLVR